MKYGPKLLVIYKRYAKSLLRSAEMPITYIIKFKVLDIERLKVC